MSKSKPSLEYALHQFTFISLLAVLCMLVAGICCLSDMDLLFKLLMGLSVGLFIRALFPVIAFAWTTAWTAAKSHNPHN